MKMRVYVLFKGWYELKPSVTPLALSMIDPSKGDVKDLMNLVVDSVSEKEIDGVLKTIGTHFCSPFKEEDMICYGLNLFRGIYNKFDCSDDCDSGSCSGDSCCHDSGSCNNDTNCNNDSSSFIHSLKEKILNYAECFKDSKTKSITYSYRALINTIKHKKDTGREIDFILRKLTKEERLEQHKNNKKENKTNRELYKAEKKELSKKKSKRKFKLSKKRLKINAMKKKF